MADRPDAPLRVLVIAEACNPTWTSVPLVGYNFTRALAERDDLRLTVLTHIRNKPGLTDDPLTKRAGVHFIDNEWVARPLYNLSKWVRGGQALSWTTDTAMAWPSYMVFEKEVFHRFGRRLAQGDFDLIHRITPLTPTMGSPLAGLTDVPMLVGPLNGGLPWPKEYPELRKQEREWLVPVRRLYRSLPYYRSTYARLAGVIAGSKHTATELPTYYRGRRYYMPENGVDPARFPLAEEWPAPQGKFRFISVGRLVPYKGMDMVLEAMAGSAALKQCELWIIGDGPQKPALEAQVKQAGLDGCVHLPGWIEQKQLAQELGRSQAFVFPSLREFGGGVVLEALARGLPAIIVNYGGPAELVTPECGELLPMTPRPQLVAALRQAMEGLVADPERCRRLGTAACAHVRREFTWDAKAERIAQIYRDLLK